MRAECLSVHEDAETQYIEPIIQWPPYPERRPACLLEGDNRFDVRKQERVYVCDACGHRVPYSSKTRQTGPRAVAEFLGCYSDGTWKGTIPPGRALKLAWESRLVDCTWLCSEVCGMRAMGGGKDSRWKRPKTWRENWYSPQAKRKK